MSLTFNLDICFCTCVAVPLFRPFCKFRGESCNTSHLKHACQRTTDFLDGREISVSQVYSLVRLHNSGETGRLFVSTKC